MEVELSPRSVLAFALGYPAPGRKGALATETRALPPGPVKDALAAFLKRLQALTLGQWEELYTRTWDLSPIAAPYLGFQVYGDDYRRGKLMALLQRRYRDLDLDLAGELPDHLVPVLRCLDADPNPLPELLEIFGPALERIRALLRKADPENPYLPLVEAVVKSGSQEVR